MKLRNLLKGTPAHKPLVSHFTHDELVRRGQAIVDEATRIPDGMLIATTPEAAQALMALKDPRCTAITTRKTRCKVPAEKNGKCVFHQPKT